MKSVDQPWQLVSIDPGVHHTAIALWLGNRLHAVDYVKNGPRIGQDIEVLTGGAEVELALVESQYLGRGAKDTIDLSYWAGGAALNCNAKEVKRIPPRTWKGTGPKNLKCFRTYGALNVEEKFRLEQSMQGWAKKPLDVIAKNLRDNPKKKYGKSGDEGKLTDLLDAIGIGLWELKR